MKRQARGAIWAQPIGVTPDEARRIRCGYKTGLYLPVSKKNTRLSRGNWELLNLNEAHATPIGTIVTMALFEGRPKPVTMRCLFVPEQLVWLNDGRPAHICKAMPGTLWVQDVTPHRSEILGTWAWHIRFAVIIPSVDEALRDAKSGLLHHWIPR